MNANELAGRLLQKKLYLIDEGVNSSYLEEAATMLRQQAGRIEKLEAEAKAKNNYLDQHCQKIDALHNLVKEQDKKIVDLAFRAVYAERSAQLAYDPKKHGAEE